MVEKKAESGGTKGPAKQREKAASTTSGGVRNVGAKTTIPLLDINHCTARQLSLIPGVSREVGDRIVATRRRLGGSFQYFDQLHTIKGVTRVVVQALRGRVQVPCEKATSIGEPEGYMRLGPVQSQSSLLSLNSLGDVARRKAAEKQENPPKVTPRPSYGGKKSRTPTKQVSTPPRKTVKVQRNLAKTKTPTRSSKIHGKSTKTPATSRAKPSNRQAAANRSVEGKNRLKSPRKPGKSPVVSSKRPPTGRLGKTKTLAKRPAKKTGTSASRSRSRTPKRATNKSSARAASASKPPRPSPRRKKAVSVSPQTKKIKTTPRRAKTTPRRESAVTYQVVTSPVGQSTWTYPSSRGRATTRQPPVLVLKIETSPTQQQTAETAQADAAVDTSKTPQVEVEETSVSSGSRSRRASKKSANKSVEVTPGDSASATAGSKTPAVPSTTAGANAPAVEVEKDPARLRSRSSVEAVEKWLESTARYSTDLPQQEQGDDCSSRHTRQGMEDITSEYKSAVAYPASTASAERAKGTQPVQTDSQGWNVAEGDQTQPSPEEPPAAKDAEGNDTQGNEKEPVAVEQVEAGAEVAGTPTGRERRRRHHRHRRSRDEPSPKRRKRSFDSGNYPTCSVL
ncbi:uncharacterized protein LOC144902467 [Branchiostoma floridae x Branchiostoma belcheri]